MSTNKSMLAFAAALVGFSAIGCQNGDTIGPDSKEPSSALPGPTKVGEEIAATFRSPAVSAADSDALQLVWQQEIAFAGATYIALHFDRFQLPEGAFAIVRTPDQTRARTYAGQGKEVPGDDGFWAMHMPGERAIVEIYSRVSVPEGAVSIDRFARGLDTYKDLFPSANEDFGPEAICGADDSDWAKCFEDSEPEVYNRSRAVARLMIGGSSACTGWLIGSEGHLMTNEHCIGSAAQAANTDYEFMAEGASCNTSCATFGGCPGVVEADTATLVQLDSTLDYALVLLPVNVTDTYGFFQLREGGGQVGDRIYIPQHPAAWGKRFALKDGSEDAVITSLNAPPCTGGGGADVGYFADTRGGSSGSPVVGYNDHLVVALHHCANCPNRGVPVQPIIDDLTANGNLPADAVGNGCEPAPVADAGPDQNICAGDSADLGTPAQPDTTYSWSPDGETSAQITVSPAQTTTYTLTATTSCGSATDTVTVSVDNGNAGLTESFDGDISGWTTSGLWHQVSNSSCADPGYSSEPGAMYYGQDASCNYNDGTNSGDLISPQIFGITADTTLRFDYFRRVESYNGAFDKTSVLVSTDNGTNWTEVFYRDSSDASENAWTSSGDISLAEFAGQTIQIRFEFDSVDGIANNFTGWFIDDVVVTGSSSCGG